MKDLLSYIITNIAGDDFEIKEVETDAGRVDFEVSADPSIIGLIIGKMGKTIKMIRKILSIRAVIEEKSVGITVIEK